MKDRKLKINWYPGHMKKTKETIEENLKQVDLVFELIDARAPLSSQNPLLKDIMADKASILIFNKTDLADEKETKDWVNYYEDQREKVVLLNAHNGQGMSRLYEAIDQVMADKRSEDKKKGLISDQVKAMIVGIPNVGKSTLINSLLGRRSTNVGDRPGVTKKKQWIKVKDRNLLLLDTPGVLWPKFEDQYQALHLAYIGSIKDDVLPIEDIAMYLLEGLSEFYPKNIEERYKIQIQDSPIETMEEIGRRRGAIISGGYIDYTRVAQIILDDFRKGRLGRITLDKIDV